MEARSTGVRIEYVGHATVLVAMDGVRLLTDPLLRNRVAHLHRAVRVDAGALRGIDAVLISHLHYDHLDLPSLQRLGRDVPLVVPRGAGSLLRRKGRFANVVEVSPADELRVGALTLTATEADHDGSRLPFGARAQPVGYRIVGGRSVYFAGDTAVFDRMADLGPVDVALLPIWGWGPALGPGHMDPAGAARAASLLAARVVVPIHWGTYFPLHHGLMRPPRWLETPPEEFRARMAEIAPDIEVRVLAPGAATVVSEPESE